MLWHIKTPILIKFPGPYECPGAGQHKTYLEIVHGQYHYPGTQGKVEKLVSMQTQCFVGAGCWAEGGEGIINLGRDMCEGSTRATPLNEVSEKGFRRGKRSFL